MRRGDELQAEFRRLEPIGWEHLWSLVIAHREEYVASVIERGRRVVLNDEETEDQPRSGALVLNDIRRAVTWREDEIRFTPTEYRMIACLARAGGAWVAREEMYREVYGLEEEGIAMSDLIRAHIRGVRRACNRHQWPEIIQGRRRLGYRLAVNSGSVIWQNVGPSSGLRR